LISFGAPLADRHGQANANVSSRFFFMPMR